MDKLDDFLRSAIDKELARDGAWNDPPAWWFALQGIREGKLGPLAEVFRAAGAGDEVAVNALFMASMLHGEEIAAFLRGDENDSGVVVTTKAGASFSKITETPARKSASMLRELKIYQYAVKRGLNRSGQYDAAVLETAKHFNKTPRSISGSIAVARNGLEDTVAPLGYPHKDLFNSPAYKRLIKTKQPPPDEDN